MLTEKEYRDTAREFLDYAGAGPVGRKTLDPVYQSLCEGRDPKIKDYSSCADAAHWLLFRMGVRSLAVNRDENHGWKFGVNVSDLAFWPVAKDAHPDDQYKVGDLVVIWELKSTTDAHVMCVLDYDPGSKVMTVCEAGQGAPYPIALHTHQLRQGNDYAGVTARTALFCGTRAIQKWIPLMDALAYADARGELSPIDRACLDAPMPGIADVTAT